MLTKTYCSSIQGIRATLITIEVNITQGIRFFIVGLADHAIRESQQRIESAITSSGFNWPRFRVVINLAPADIRKEGTHYDLPLAIGIMAASAQVKSGRLKDYMLLGELSLDGSIMPVRGALPMTLNAREKGFSGVIVPRGNAKESSVVDGIRVIPVAHLHEVSKFLNGTLDITPVRMDPEVLLRTGPNPPAGDFAEVRGQENVKRALLVAAAGNHNILLLGPPGSGKTMLARRLPGILTPMGLEEALQTTKIHSVAGKTGAIRHIISTRPFRSPHHSISDIGLIGGGNSPMPGEISLAHNGVLFLDELPEFRRSVLELLRQPLEERVIHVSRANYTVEYPANFMLVASMNPCPCGYYNHPDRACNCGPGPIKRYLSRISGPLLDRIDIHVEVVPIPFGKLHGNGDQQRSALLRGQVAEARRVQEKRFAAFGHLWTNAQMDSALLKVNCILDPAGMALLGGAMERLGLSARAHDRILKVARTIADLDGSDQILVSHLAEAVQYRTLDREGWSG